jgi:glyceraldehyde-3-phosphate dehydrogenase (NAD(P))
MIRVAVNGYGTIGRRVADAVLKQPDMKLVGISKQKADYRARAAYQKGIPIFLPDKKYLTDFEKAGIPTSGSVDDLLNQCEVVIDATPEDVGASNRPLYERSGKLAIFQGGEAHDVAGFSFVAQCNFESAAGRKNIRVVSCNTTGLCRLLNTLGKNFGIRKARAVLARRAADPDEVSKGPIDAVVLDPTTVPSHHGHDVRTVLGSINIVTMAYKVPTTHMHLHSLLVTLNKKPSKEESLLALEGEPRIATVDGKGGFKSTASLVDFAREKNRPRNDIYEVVVWRDSVTLEEDEIYMFLAVHQEAIVVPENIDAVRALIGGYNREQSMNLTDTSLGIISGKW